MIIYLTRLLLKLIVIFNHSTQPKLLVIIWTFGWMDFRSQSWRSTWSPERSIPEESCGRL